jgi:protein involved in polysaccharide export with SLBB domain
MRRLAVVLAALAFAGLAASCGAVTHAAGGTVELGQQDAGRTVQVNVGDTVRVKLMEDRPVPGSSVTWAVTSSLPSVLKAGSVTRNPAAMTPVGSDTYTADFLALTGGQALLNAHGITSCEAMAKANCPDRAFEITVVVRA